MKRILIIRFSAMGDVAMTLPIVYAAATQYPQASFILLTRHNFAPLFLHPPKNLRVIGIDLRQYKGLNGLWRLFKEIHAQKPTAVADLHNVIRTKILRLCFTLCFTPTATIHKGRRQKRQLTRPKHKRLRQLPTSFERYAQVLAKLHLPIKPQFQSLFANTTQDLTDIQAALHLPNNANEHWIGFAPFAKHQGKIYPQTQSKEVLTALSKEPKLRIFLFGGGKDEINTLQAWQQELPQCLLCSGKLSLEQELRLMSQLKVMISMDSANMHLASLVGVPVISIWGATHPYAGFLGWQQASSNVVQIDLPCRPCSVFGNKACSRGDYACLKQIKPELIIKKALSYCLPK